MNRVNDSSIVLVQSSMNRGHCPCAVIHERGSMTAPLSLCSHPWTGSMIVPLSLCSHPWTEANDCSIVLVRSSMNRFNDCSIVLVQSSMRGRSLTVRCNQSEACALQREELHAKEDVMLPSYWSQLNWGNPPSQAAIYTQHWCRNLLCHRWLQMGSWTVTKQISALVLGINSLSLSQACQLLCE